MTHRPLLSLAILAFGFSTLPALAGADTAVVHYPRKACAEIVSQEYSTGGTESSLQYLEILCRDAEGNYTGFVDSWRTAAGLIGFGRMSTPDVFKYTPHDGEDFWVDR